MIKYLRNEEWSSYKIPKCPNCNFIWNVRLYYDTSNPGNVFEETDNFKKISEFNKETNINKITHLCYNCKYSFVQENKILSEQELMAKINASDPKINIDELTSNQTIITQTISGKDITSDKLEEIIKNMENNL